MSKKKLLMGCGTIATMALPIVAIISCGNNDKKKTDIDTSNLNDRLFKFKGVSGSGTIALAQDQSVDDAITITAWKGAKANSGSQDFVALNKITKLALGDVVTIKFAIASASQATKQFPSTFKTDKQTIEVTFKTNVDTTNLNSGLFTFEGSAGVGTIKQVTTNKSIDDAIEITAQKSGSAEFVTLNEIKELVNNETITIKFAIKSGSQTNKQFPDDFIETIEVIVSGLAKTDVDITNLNGELFTFEGSAGVGTIKQAIDKSIDDAIEITAQKSGSAEFVTLNEIKGLSNDDIVTIKFAIKSGSQTNKQFPNNFIETIEVIVSGLAKTNVDITNLNSFLFTYSKISGSGRISEGTISKIRNKSVDDAIAITAQKSGSAEFVPLNEISLTEVYRFADRVTIKFTIKSGSQTNKKFPDGFGSKKQTIKLYIKNGKIKNVIDRTDLNAELFTFVGDNGSGTITLAQDKSIDDSIKIMAWKGSGTYDAWYNNLVPLSTISGLANGDKVTILFSIKDVSKATNKLSSSPFKNIEITIGGLT